MRSYAHKMSAKIKINVFLPCKKNSTRVKNKNTRKFASEGFGLLKIKIFQLLKAKQINKIYLSTNDEKIKKFVKKINSKKIVLHSRKDFSLSTNNTSNNQLVSHVLDVVPTDHILWTHVTSPFVNSKIYDDAIKKYKNILKKGYDSMMSITKLKGFIWDSKKALNYNYLKVKWPKTQDIKPLNKINSAIFISSRKNYLKYNNRIGKKPFMYELKKYYGLDIDDVEDFYLAEFLFKNRKKYK